MIWERIGRHCVKICPSARGWIVAVDTAYVRTQQLECILHLVSAVRLRCKMQQQLMFSIAFDLLNVRRLRPSRETKNRHPRQRGSNRPARAMKWHARHDILPRTPLINLSQDTVVRRLAHAAGSRQFPSTARDSLARHGSREKVAEFFGLDGLNDVIQGTKLAGALDVGGFLRPAQDVRFQYL
jgi:hypothetical protein